MRPSHDTSAVLRFTFRSLPFSFAHNRPGKEYVWFYPGEGCESPVGAPHDEGNRHVSLASACMERGVVQHELIHILGFWHEQSRIDRDQYVDIIWENIEGNREDVATAAMREGRRPLDVPQVEETAERRGLFGFVSFRWNLRQFQDVRGPDRRSSGTSLRSSLHHALQVDGFFEERAEYDRPEGWHGAELAGTEGKTVRY